MSSPQSSPQSIAGRGISGGMVLLFAVATGQAVACNYLAQPLLETLRNLFGVSEATAGLIVTAAQIGYAAGLILMLPLAMATDPCHGPDSPFRVCQLTPAGQNFLVFIPWMVVVGALVFALVSATLLARRKISPLYGLWFWAAGGVIIAVVANEIAYRV